MRTIGKRLPKRRAGDFVSQCSECRAKEYRSKLVLFADGQLRHPGCHKGPTALELSMRNADRARAQRQPPPMDGPAPGTMANDFTTPVYPTNPMVGWAWVNVDGTVRASSPSVAITKPALDIHLQLDVDFDFGHVTQLESTADLLGGGIPLLLSLGRAGPRTAVLRARNRFDTPGSTGPRGVLVLLYGAGGLRMLTQVATAWVKGSDGTIIDQEGATVAASRTGAGLYTLTLSGTARFASITHQVQGDPSLATAVMPRISMVSGSVGSVVCQDRTGTNTDADILVRFLA